MAQENLRIDGLEIIGEPVDGKMGFQPAVTRVAQDIHDLDHLILIIIIQGPVLGYLARLAYSSGMA